MSSADTSVTVDYSRNRLAIPGLVGDPFLSFDCDVPAGYCVTGTAIGAVALWRLDHVAEILLGKAAGDSSTAAAPADQVATDEVVCRMLASTSDEGIRHVFIRDEQVFAVVGDVQVKIWGSWHDPTSQVKKFDRAHDYKTCKETFTLRHEMKLLVMTLNQDDCLILDLETMMHTPFKLPIPQNATPMYFDGVHLILLQLTDEGMKLVQVFDIKTQKLVHTLILEREQKYYWGFQLAAHSSSSASAVTATPSSDDQKTAPSSSSSAPRLLLSYISNHHYLKAVPLDSVPSGLTYGELRRNGGRVPKERPRTVDLLTHRIEVAKGSSHVLAYLYDAPTRTFITLNGDAKIKIFALESGSGAAASGASKSPGRLLKKYRHIAGSFKLGYPYILKKIGADLIFYTADEGVYLLRIG